MAGPSLLSQRRNEVGGRSCSCVSLGAILLQQMLDSDRIFQMLVLPLDGGRCEEPRLLQIMVSRLEILCLFKCQMFKADTLCSCLKTQDFLDENISHKTKIQYSKYERSCRFRFSHDMPQSTTRWLTGKSTLFSDAKKLAFRGLPQSSLGEASDITNWGGFK